MTHVPEHEAFLPYNQPDISDAEIEAAAEVLRSGWLAPGQRARAFEEALAGYASAKHAVALDSATAGMHLALVAMGIGSGDEVITTPLTFAATVNVIIHAGATPLLADVLDDDLCIDPRAVEQAITPRTKAIMPVHHAGAACRMSELRALAASAGARIVEDAAHALGTSVDGARVGATRDAAVFSFYPTKNLTTARGGMLTSDDDELAARCRLLALHGMSDDAWDRYTARGSWEYRVLAPGYNYAMTDLQAALGLAQLARLPEFQAKRRRLAERYTARLAGTPELRLPAERDGTVHAWHLYVIRLRAERLRITRAAFIEALREAGVGTSVHFIPIHHHPYYRETFGWKPGDFPAADAAFEGMISLPLYTRMEDADVDRVCDAVLRIVRAHRL